MSDDALRRAYRAHLTATGIDGDATPQPPAERRECPSPELLAQLAQGAGALGALDHVLQCPSCLPEFELLRTLGRAEHDARRAEDGLAQVPAARDATPPGAISAPAGASRRWRASGWAMAATVLVAAALGGTWWQQQRGIGGPGSGEDGARGGAVVRGDDGGAVVVTPNGWIGTEPLVFTWRGVGAGPVGGADVRYVVEAFDSVGGLVLSRTVRDTVYVPSGVETDALRRAGTFDWMVRAERGDGNERRSSLVRARFRVPNGTPLP